MKSILTTALALLITATSSYGLEVVDPTVGNDDTPAKRATKYNTNDADFDAGGAALVCTTEGHVKKVVGGTLVCAPDGGDGETDITIGHNSTTVLVESSTGTDGTIVAADTDDAGIMTAAMYDQYILNTGKVTYPGDELTSDQQAAIDNASTAPTAANPFVTEADAGSGTNWEQSSQGVIHASNYVDNNTHINQAGIEAFGFVTGAHTVDTDTQLSDGEVKTSYENNANTNAFTDSEKTFLGSPTGSDTEIVTGTAGTEDNCAKWNADGDLVDSGDPCGVGGTDITDLETLTGAGTGATDYGDFTGGIITSNQVNKDILQELSDAIEGLGGGHDAVTVNATANGLSVDGSQVLTMGLSSTSTIGALSDTDWDIFNNKSDFDPDDPGPIGAAPDTGNFTTLTATTYNTDGSDGDHFYNFANTGTDSTSCPTLTNTATDIGARCDIYDASGPSILPFWWSGTAWVASSSGSSVITDLTGTADRVLYVDSSGDVSEIVIGVDGTVLKSNGATSAPSFQADETGSSGTVAYVEQQTDAVDGAQSAGTFVFNNGDGTEGMWFQGAAGLYTMADPGYTPTATTYDLDLTISGLLSGDSITVGGTAYTTSQTITGLSDAVQTLTVAYGGTNDTMVWSGDDGGTVTGSDPNYTIDMSSDDRAVTGTFSEAGGVATPEILWETYDSVGYDDAGWTPDGTNPLDPDYATAIEGTQSLRKHPAAEGLGDIFTLSSDLADGYYSFAINYTDVAGVPILFKIKDATDTQIAQVRLWTDGLSYYAYNGTSSVGPNSFDFTTGITYIGVHYNSGDGTLDFWVQSTPLGTSWGTADISLTANLSTDVHYVNILGGGSGEYVYNAGVTVDAVGISASEVAWDGL